MTEVKFIDDDIRKLYNKGMNDRQIAEELESRQWIICERRNKLGLKPNRNRKYMRKFTDQQLIELHSIGLSDGEIGKKLGVTATAIGQRRRKLNLEPNHVSRLPRIRKYQTKKEDMTTIQVSHSTMKELKKLGSKGESYLSIIEKLIDLED